MSGIAPTQFENNVAYIKGWLDTLEKDRRFIILATSQAQKATDFILNLKKEEKPEEEVLEVVKEDDVPI
ncbi:MAG: hypothetical protein H0W62_02075 [Chitinophagales bacterium]|nr:hypothetical protein [Chitinophagales bacterium]